MGQCLPFHSRACYMDGAVFVEGDLGTVSESQRQEWALCQPQAEQSPEHGMAAAAQKMAALGKAVCHRLVYDKKKKMRDVCFQGNLVLTDSCEEHYDSAVQMLFTLEEPGDIDTFFVNTEEI